MHDYIIVTFLVFVYACYFQATKRKLDDTGKKLAIFQSFYFSDYRPGKCVFRYSRRKKRLSKL